MKPGVLPGGTFEHVKKKLVLLDYVIYTPIMSGFPTSAQGKDLILSLSRAIHLLFTSGILFSTAAFGGEIYEQNDPLSMDNYMQRVVEFNETVQGKLLGFQAARHMRLKLCRLKS
jgi:hypothetical protein